ncbi:hypothetical protein ACYX8G_16080 [Microbacterium saperdae]
MATFAIGTVVANRAGTTATGNGWHQGARKPVEAESTALIIEMGARLDVPALGRFLQVAPVEGGVDKDYVWPTDPIGSSDVSGKAAWDCEGFWRTTATVAVLVAAAGATVACGVTIVCAVTVGAAAGAPTYAASNGFSERFTWKGLAGSAVLGAATGGGAGTILKAVARSTAAARPLEIGQRSYRLHFDQKPHGNRWWNNRSHWQMNTWRAGVKGVA